MLCALETVDSETRIQRCSAVQYQTRNANANANANAAPPGPA